MKKTNTLAHRCRTLFVAALGSLVLCAPAARAWELGLITSWIDNENGGGASYGSRLMLRHELWKYVDVGARVGFMRSDFLSAEFVPLEATLALKYPFCDGRIVPFIGVAFGYHFYTGDVWRNSQALTPNIGLDWRFGQDKKWSLFVEGVYQFSHVHLVADNTIEPVTDGVGGSIGVSFRF